MIISVPHELICILKYKLAHPAYIKVNSTGHTKALIFSGYYDLKQIPILRANTLGPLATFISAMHKVPHRFKLFLAPILENLNFLAYFLISRICPFFKNNNSKEKLLFMQLQSFSFPV